MLNLAPLAGGGLLLFYGLFSTGSASLLIIEDGSNVAGANSLISASEVSNRALLTGNATWDAASSTNQEQAIYRAMQWFRGLEGVMKGCRTYEDQSLPWPRRGVVVDCRLIAHNVIPQDLKDALMEAAMIELDDPGVLQKSREIGIRRLYQKVDALEKEVEYAGSGVVGEVNYPKIMGMLRQFLDTSSSWSAW